jgi:hypothetical protein
VAHITYRLQTLAYQSLTFVHRPDVALSTLPLELSSHLSLE